MVPIPRNSWVYGKFNAISLFKAFIVSLKISCVCVFFLPSRSLQLFAEKSQTLDVPDFSEKLSESLSISASLYTTPIRRTLIEGEVDIELFISRPQVKCLLHQRKLTF